MIKRVVALLVAPLLLAMMALPVNAAPKFDDVAERLICQCGCLMVLNSCSHAECTSRETMTGVVKQKLAEGQTADQIVQSFVRQYGEKVLSEPPKQGFNLTAWLFPWVSIGAGMAAIVIVLRKWVRRRIASPEAAQEAGRLEQRYGERLEKELRDFSERGFR